MTEIGSLENQRGLQGGAPEKNKSPLLSTSSRLSEHPRTSNRPLPSQRAHSPPCATFAPVIPSPTPPAIPLSIPPAIPPCLSKPYHPRPSRPWRTDRTCRHVQQAVLQGVHIGGPEGQEFAGGGSWGCYRHRCGGCYGYRAS